MIELQTDKVILKGTVLNDLDSIILFEKEHSDYVNLYTKNEHLQIIDNECHFSIFTKPNNELIGHVILADIKTKQIEFRRIVISKKGLGYGNHAIKLIKEICYEKFNADKIWLDVYSDNIRAIKLYKKYGFVEKEVVEIENSNRKLLILENFKKKL